MYTIMFAFHYLTHFIILIIHDCAVLNLFRTNFKILPNGIAQTHCRVKIFFLG